jgi:hypothetical protein
MLVALLPECAARVHQALFFFSYARFLPRVRQAFPAGDAPATARRAAPRAALLLAVGSRAAAGAAPLARSHSCALTPEIGNLVFQRFGPNDALID